MLAVKNALLVFSTLLLFGLTACDRGGGGELCPAHPVFPYHDDGTVELSDATVHFLEQEGSFTFETDLGPDPKDVYFIITNSSLSGDATGLDVESLSAAPPEPVFTEEMTLMDLMEMTRARGIRGRPEEVREFLRERYEEKGRSFLERFFSERFSDDPLLRPLYDAQGDSGTFMYDPVTSVPSTCRKVVTVDTAFGMKTLNIWVADDCWHETGTDMPHYVTEEMVNTLADLFLLSGYDNDIYDYVTSIFGEEWGPTGTTGTIGVSDEITILLYDIDADKSTNGGVLGFFHPKDNYRDTYLSSSYESNERIMFYLDAVLYATKDSSPDDGWSMADHWPAEIISTLAHELHHMIHHYQKTLLRAGQKPTERWIEELSSLATEDIVSSRIGVPGPRGVDYDLAGPGTAFNTGGRLPLYNKYACFSLRDFDSYEGYSLNYSLGAYMLRNYDGSDVLTRIVQSSRTNYTALTCSAGSDLETLLSRWGVAVLLSDMSDVPEPYALNRGDNWYTGSLGFTMGSINNYYYSYQGQDGPLIRPFTDIGPDDSIENTSNTFLMAGDGETGLQSWEITLPSGCRCTVVIRPDQ